MRSSVNESKKQSQHKAAFGKGGKGKMFGEQAAAEKVPGIAGKKDIRGPGGRFAKGGPKVATGGFARKAVGGHTGPCDEE